MGPKDRQTSTETTRSLFHTTSRADELLFSQFANNVNRNYITTRYVRFLNCKNGIESRKASPIGYGLFKLKHLLCLHRSINSAEKLSWNRYYLHFKKSLS